MTGQQVELGANGDDPREELRRLLSGLPELHKLIEDSLRADPSFCRFVGESFRRFIKVNEDAIAIHRRIRELSQKIDEQKRDLDAV